MDAVIDCLGRCREAGEDRAAVADGVGNRRIGELVGASPTTVIAWRGRYQESGLSGLANRGKPGRPRELDHRAIVAETLKAPPKKLGVTHWSTRCWRRG